MSGSNAGAGQTYLTVFAGNRLLRAKRHSGIFCWKFLYYVVVVASKKPSEPIIQQPCDWLLVFTTKVSSSSKVAWDHETEH